MPVQNSLVKKESTFGAFITNDTIKNYINNMIGGKDGKQFMSSIISAVSNNPTLQECEHKSILSAALLGQSLNLSPSPQLGQYYLVPFNNKQKNVKVAQFQIGYKGYIQLAIRSGYYKKLNVLSIKEGELIKYDPLNEEIEVKLIEDDIERENAKTVGYYAMFEYQNGFRKTLYWSIGKMQKHADTYSQAFKLDSYIKLQEGKIPENDLWKYSSFWYKDFDGMAYKTMLRQLISKWGIMSIELQTALEKDMAEIKDDGTVSYIDNNQKEIEVTKIEDENPEELPEDNPEYIEEEYEDPFKN